MARISARVASVAVLLLPACSAPPSSEPADLVLCGGIVWTANPEQPTARAIAIRGERIVRVGSDADVLALRGPTTRVIDLDGRLVVPGFNDTHVHFASAARFLEFNVMATRDQAEFLARLRDAVAAVGPGEWITGGFWGAYDQWAAASAGGAAAPPFTPDLREAVAFTNDNPVFLEKFDRSEFALNDAAMRAIGIDPDDPRLPGAEFVRDDAGRPTGIVRGEGAVRLYAGRTARPLSPERRRQQTLGALREVARRGVTSFSDMSDDVQLRIWHELRRAGELTARVHFRPGLEQASELAARGIRVGSGDAWVRLGAVKGHIDGIMGTNSARFFEPYANDPHNRGRWRPLMLGPDGEIQAGRFLRYMLDADRAGIQMTVHAIGDEANRVVLDYLTEVVRENGERDRRFRLVHAQVVHPDDLPRFGELRVIVEVQPFHLSDDMRWMAERIGDERCANAYAFKSLADAGAVLAFGSDWPGTSASEYPIDPMLGLYAAVTRQTLRGEPDGGWFPAQRLSIEQALRAYTLAGAFASFEERDKGTLGPGMFADLVVLSRNLLAVPPREIPGTEVLCTVVGGRVVFEGF
jgi:hypothetical protein